MEITEIRVTVHEKRNHPFEYGHYDCEVSLVASNFTDDSPTDDTTIKILRDMARVHVEIELDNWEDRVKEKREKENLLKNAEHQISNLYFCYGQENYDERKLEVVRAIEKAPQECHDYLFDRLKTEEINWGKESPEEDIPF